MGTEPLDWISIENLQVHCIIGMFTEERTDSQPVVVNLRLGLSTRNAGRNEDLRGTVDYHALGGQVKFLLSTCRFRLIETAAETLAAYLLAPPALGERRSAVQRAVVEVHKPRAMPAPTTARLIIERDAAMFVPKIEAKSFGTVDVIFETPDWGIYRLNVAPGKEIPLHVHKKMREHELVLTSGLVARGQSLYPGTAFHWPHGAAHHYLNPTTEHQTILCVDSPPFIPEDEVEASGEPAEIVPEHVWAPRGADGWSTAPRR
jgi:FolB domain-containing protein